MEKPHTHICSLGEFTKVGANDSNYKGNKTPVSIHRSLQVVFVPGCKHNYFCCKVKHSNTVL